MKKIFAIITIAMVAAVFAFAGCQKQQEAPKPAVQSATTMTSTMTTTAPAAPEHK